MSSISAFKRLFATGTRTGLWLGLFAVSGAIALPAHANYRAKATAATDYIQSKFYDANEGLYRAASPPDPKALPYDFMWANGVQFPALVGATKWQPDRYGPVLASFTKGLQRYWDKDATIPGFDAYFSSKDGDDKYYDDNAWLVIGFSEAYRVTKDPMYLKWSRDTMNFVLSGWDDKLGGGLYWHQQELKSKNTCVIAPAIVGILALYEEDGHKASDLEWAKKMYVWTNSHLQDKDGLYWDNINLDSKVEKTKWTYNSALMIRANLGLYQATKDAKYLKEARRVADAGLARWANAQSGAFADDARFNHLFSEALLRTYDATKDIKYLDAVRRHADFGYRYVRDVRDGGYFNNWNDVNRPADERKLLIENASTARLFWLLAPYLDTEELRARGDEAARKGDYKTAKVWFDQAFDSTAGPAPTQKTVS